MFEWAIAECRRRGCSLVQLYTDKSRKDAHRFYERLGFTGSFFLMLSSGGIATVDTAVRHPVRLLESGPAAGALAATYYGQAAGYPNLLSLDMGGTTAKLCVIDQGRPLIAHDFEVARVYRFKLA